MTNFIRAALPACLLALLLAAVPPAWAQAPALPRDPALVIGTLPNGLRYYLRANRAPAKRAELRLVVNAGSALEADDQQGFAHFLEHMAFNGTRHFPHNSLIDFIESSGMSFGADLNAYTSFDETVYTLTVPTDDPAILEKGLTVLEDWASGGITIDSAETVAERGVVVSEWRGRLTDSLSRSVNAHYEQVLLGGSRYIDRFPIGRDSLLRRANPEPIARFYRDWYRPDLMAIVVVGDFDGARMEQEIRRRFGAIAAPRRAPRRLAPSLAVARRPQVDVYRGPVSPRIDVLWQEPAPPTDRVAAFRAGLVDWLWTHALEQRLLEIRQRTSRPYITAAPTRGRYVRPLPTRGVSIIAWPDSLERALATVLGEMERLAQHGVPPGMLERQKAELLRRLESEAAASESRASSSLADAYAEHYLTGEHLLASPVDELALARRLLPAIGAADVARAAAAWRQRRGMRVLVAMPQFAHVRPPTRDGILALFDSVANARLAPESDRAVVEGPLMARPPAAGKIVAETTWAAAGITAWTLSNGARVLFKPSANDPGEVLVRAWSPGGFSQVPDSLFYTTGRMVAPLMTEAAGLGERPRSELLRQLATTSVRRFRVDIGYADESIDLGGSPEDLTTLFQLLHLQFTAPRLDSAAVASWRTIAQYQARGFSFDDQLDQTFARGNARMMPVQTHLAELVSVKDAMAVYRHRFGDAGDFTFVIVGAATVDEVRPLVERYVASLPGTARPRREEPVQPDVVPFQDRLRMRFATNEVARADALLVFDGVFPTAPDAYLRERRLLGAVGGILGRRLRERMREQLGATYSPIVVPQTYLLPPEHFRLVVSFHTAPERIDELQRELFGILDSLRTHGATPDELARWARIQQRRLETALQDNEYWMTTIGRFERLDIPLDQVVASPDAPLTGDEFREAAKRYLSRDVFIQMTAVPRDTAMVDATPERAHR